ncbi:MAG: ATP-binding protein, partial [Ferruginibacter sp.]
IGGYFLEVNWDSSLYYETQQLTLARKLKLKLWEGDALDQTGWLLSNLKNYPLSLQHFLDGMAILQNKDCEKNIWMISLFAKDGNPETARLKCLGFIHNDLAMLYKATGNDKKTLSTLFQGYTIAKTALDYTLLSVIALNLAPEYLKIDKPDSAFVYAQEALINMEKSGYNTYKGEALGYIGMVYLEKKNYTEAKEYFDKSLIAYKLYNNKIRIPNTFRAFAYLYQLMGENDSSIYYTQKSLAGYKELGLRDSINTTYATLYSLYKSTGQTDSSFHYLQLYTTLNDSLSIAEKEKINEYQNVGFNDQIKTQQNEQERIQKANTIRTFALIAAIIVFMLIAFLLYRNIRTRKKANELLQKQKTEIEKQKKNVEGTLVELKSTQAQLIQSEKMASLGELTVGIAHEIQNPLNFVNNFSEVSNELIDEMNVELDKGGIEEAKAIAADVKQNLIKINHHGKRAGDIVKGMLQHSQSSTGKKEPTDINGLCDEYLRLSYHGLLAKDKSFNANLKTDFDESIGHVNIIPQDIGRVLLNLYNNAFYACTERLVSAVDKKQKTGDSLYVPTVQIVTQKLNDKIEIRVSDNGNGIPRNIVDKIFQPFFTTKPTGQGTGLGLSLSYDIIKAHGGEIKVESKEREGSTFIIQLPLSNPTT